MWRTVHWLAALALCACVPRGAAGGTPPLVLERTIELPGVKGRIDHLALDATHARLYVAALGNGTVEVVDLEAGRAVGRISGLAEPQGLAVIAERDELAVASGGDGTLRFYRTADLAPAGVTKLGEDADNVRLDRTSGRLVVGFGSGALATIDPATRRVVGVTPVAGASGRVPAGRRARLREPSRRRSGRVADLTTGRSWRPGRPAAGAGTSLSPSIRGRATSPSRTACRHAS
jgi:hypothetical protein